MVNRNRAAAFIFGLTLGFECQANAYLNCNIHRVAVTQQVNLHFGSRGSVPAVTGLFYQESQCRANALNKSDGGAGLGQLTGKENIKWIGSASGIGTIDPWNVQDNIRASVWLLKFNYDEVQGMDKCEKIGAALSCYNGGCRNVLLAQQISEYPSVWFDVTEKVRHPKARQSLENFNYARSYPRKVLFKHQPKYETWGNPVCREYSYYARPNNP